MTTTATTPEQPAPLGRHLTGTKYVTGYAYASSPIADKLGAPAGCYYVGAWRQTGKREMMATFGPFDSKEAADAYAAGHN